MKTKTSDRRYILNRKCFAALRAMGKDRWEYMYVSPKGVICTNTTSLIRVSLPRFPVDVNPPEAVIFSAKTAKERAVHVQDGQATSIEMPAGEGAKSGKYSVPNLEAAIPAPENQTASIAVNARDLINLLEAACEVTEHARSLVRLRFCNGKLRIDAHADPNNNQQEFLGVLTGIGYNGNCIPGEPTGKIITQPTEMIDERKLSLPEVQGRKFR